MKESYREGVANHPGPEPFEGSRKAALEALDRGIRRLGIELRNRVVQGPDGVSQHGRPQCGARETRVRRRPVESKPPSMRRNFMRENRETPLLPVPSAGRKENAMSGKSFVNGGGESYSGVVPTKQPNKSEKSPAEVVEGRPLAKENTQEQGAVMVSGLPAGACEASM